MANASSRFPGADGVSKQEKQNRNRKTDTTFTHEVVQQHLFDIGHLV
jgi:hypothetical protein